MGTETTNFIQRIKRMLKGKSDDYTTHFEFHFVYDIMDLDSDNLLTMLTKVNTLFNYYLKQTRVPSFRRWMMEDQKYFVATSVTSLGFKKGNPHNLSKPFKATFEGSTHQLKYWETKLSFLCHSLVLTRNYKPLIDQFEEFLEKQFLNKIFGILISDLNFLKLKNYFNYLSRSLKKQIRKYRKVRLEGEKSAILTSSEIGALVNEETYRLFGLALISYLEQEPADDKFIFEVLTWKMTPEQWIENPVNAVKQFTDERLFYCLSLLMHFSHADFRNMEVAARFKKNMANKVRSFIGAFDRFYKETGIKESNSITPSSLAKIKTNFNFLLTEIGEYAYRRRYQTVRYLHKMITMERPGHNYLVSNIQEALDALDRLIDESMRLSGPESKNFIVHEKEPKEKLANTFSPTGVLEEISEAIRQFLNFAQISPKEVDRFLHGPDEDGFAKDIISLGNTFQTIRRTHRFTLNQYLELKKTWDRIVEDLFVWESPLNILLRSHIVPIEEVVSAAVIRANAMTEHQFGISNVWSESWKVAGDKLKSEGYLVDFPQGLESDRTTLEGGNLVTQVGMNDRESSEIKSPERPLVLGDPFLIQEVVKNIFSNIKHLLTRIEDMSTFDEKASLSIDLKKISKDLSDDEGTGPEDFWSLTVESRGARFKQPSQKDTFSKHQIEIERYGGSLVIKPTEGKNGTRVTLSLITRREPTDPR
jgi:hypothetical protein